jgi:WD40 repeat protein
MWPILSGGQAVTVGMHDAPIKSISWIPEMNLLVTGSWDKTLKYVLHLDLGTEGVVCPFILELWEVVVEYGTHLYNVQK